MTSQANCSKPSPSGCGPAYRRSVSTSSGLGSHFLVKVVTLNAVFITSKLSCIVSHQWTRNGLHPIQPGMDGQIYQFACPTRPVSLATPLPRVAIAVAMHTFRGRNQQQCMSDNRRNWFPPLSSPIPVSDPAPQYAGRERQSRQLRRFYCEPDGSPPIGPPVTTISTRRFCCRPAALSFVATGLALPNPTAVTVSGGTLCETK